ncbi:eukaryotic translation initiation factor 1A, X-chromosomal isoform X2 [Panthera leo]|uniref:eukaryotic translation initiation factor 1A, X-chromosomal isoform X2 n=1 Tax=Panthera leo TaxID=9689 RepID=UPI001C6A0436|nr:eukaryotic translation initiation factor 1A, X-chromosomal isoform X2 [Panthera leo]
MPKNKGKGGKNRRRGKNENESEKRELVFKEDGQEYAQVIKMLGNGRLEAMCFDGVKRLCHIRGKLRKKVWINTSDIILVGLRDYQDNKADVILKYNADEARSLKAYGELPEHAKINETDTFGPGDDDEIQFDDIGDDDEDIDDKIQKKEFLHFCSKWKPGTEIVCHLISSFSGSRMALPGKWRARSPKKHLKHWTRYKPMTVFLFPSQNRKPRGRANDE